MKRTVNFIIGLLFIAFGVVYVLNHFGIIDNTVSLKGWWALFIILPCINGLITDKDKTASLIGIVLGVLLLLAAREVFDYSVVWKVLVPVVAVIVGAKIIIRAVTPDKRTKSDDDSTRGGTSCFGGQTIDFAYEDFSSTKLSAIFGGIKCDLTNAKLRDECHVEVLCMFGGADIIVPDGVNVKIDTFSLFGGVSDKRSVQTKDADNPTIYIEGVCLFGGIEVKSER